VKFVSWFECVHRWVISAIYLAGFLLVLYRYEVFASTAVVPFERLLLSLFFVFVVLEQNYSSRSLFKVGRFKFISKLGVYTYGLYLLHPIPIAITGRLKNYVPMPSMIEGFLDLLLTCVLAYGSYNLYEKRFLALKKRFAHVESH
jgi:peptidoglycan/LPS O-acetylase OafA/YrhL